MTDAWWSMLSGLKEEFSCVPGSSILWPRVPPAGELRVQMSVGFMQEERHIWVPGTDLLTARP